MTSLGSALLGLLLLASNAQAGPALPPPSGDLRLVHYHRRESVKVNIYNPDGSYNPRAIKAVSRFLRCPRTNAEKKVEPRLLTILSLVYDHFGSRPIRVTSGYRYQRNTSSYHYRGTAVDILIWGVKPADLRAYVETLDTGDMGIGFYPHQGFVHVDVRSRSTRWVDRSWGGSVDPSRLPPPGWQKKRGRAARAAQASVGFARSINGNTAP
jgi:uncharacterized protein YcbK (DUF882 family)